MLLLGAISNGSLKKSGAWKFSMANVCTPMPSLHNFPITEKSTSAKAKGLTVEDVGAFLQSIGLPQYVETFVSNGIDGETLLGLDDNDLKELEVEKGFQRKKILIKYQTFLENK